MNRTAPFTFIFYSRNKINAAQKCANRPNWKVRANERHVTLGLFKFQFCDIRSAAAWWYPCYLTRCRASDAAFIRSHCWLRRSVASHQVSTRPRQVGSRRSRSCPPTIRSRKTVRAEWWTPHSLRLARSPDWRFGALKWVTKQYKQ